jgi:uncharacterized SAM-binding protein YcdF (DUF218 family)
MTSTRMRYATVLIGLVAAAWLAGLVLFVGAVDAVAEAPADESADAIVVLTGGSERVSAGLELLKAGRGKKLLISGVHPGLTLERILGNQAVPKNLRACCIVLGHAAESTFGNAEETLAWMDIENYHSLRLVTSNYHMPRSLMIFRAILPQMEIIPHSVSPDSVKLDEWWLRPGTTSLLVTEYDKYLWAALRLGLRQI